MNRLLSSSFEAIPAMDLAVTGLRNRLLARSAGFSLGKAASAVQLSLSAAPAPRLNAPVLALSLNGHPAWAELLWSDLLRLTGHALESLPPEDAALIIEEAISAQLDDWEARTGIETRCERLSGPPEAEGLVSAGVTLRGAGWGFSGLLWLSEGACGALIKAQSPTPAPWSALSRLFLSLRLELTGAKLTFGDLQSLQIGDALLLPRAPGGENLVLEDQYIASAKPRPDGAVTLTSPFQPRNLSDGAFPMTAQSQPPQTAPEAISAPKPAPADTAINDVGDIELRLSFRLGEALIPVNELRNMGPGTTIVLDRPDGGVVDVVVNGQSIGKGELITVSGQRAVEIRKLFSDG